MKTEIGTKLKRRAGEKTWTGEWKEEMEMEHSFLIG